MNASRLLEIISKIIKLEKENEITQRIDQLSNALANIASSPGDTNAQAQVSKFLNALSDALRQANSELQPAELKRAEELLLKPIISEKIPSQIRAWLEENAGTPSVAHNNLTKFVTSRNELLNTIKSLEKNLQNVGIEIIDLDEGDAEIGFLLPRDIFNNNLEGLIKELRTIKRIIRSFSEATTGSVEEIEIRQISTSDPTFFFGLGIPTILKIGAAITWALATWKKVEEIRNIRAQTSNIDTLKGSDIEALFDSKITETINKAIDNKVEEILGDKGTGGRLNEQKSDLKFALNSILARVERGMTVEVRLIPPPQAEADENGEDAPTPTPEDAMYEELASVANELRFPAVEGQPVLALPNADDDGKPDKASKEKGK